jgi:hypothetical protein
MACKTIRVTLPEAPPLYTADMVEIQPLPKFLSKIQIERWHVKKTEITLSS